MTVRLVWRLHSSRFEHELGTQVTHLVTYLHAFICEYSEKGISDSPLRVCRPCLIFTLRIVLLVESDHPRAAQKHKPLVKEETYHDILCPPTPR